MVFQIIFGFCHFLGAEVFVLGQIAHSKTKTRQLQSDKTQISFERPLMLFPNFLILEIRSLERDVWPIATPTMNELFL